MDKEWMSKSRLSMEYENGVEYFLNFAIENGKDPNSMSCPCVKCGNLRDADLKTIRAHLTYNGIDLTYRCWILHGDRYRSDTTNIEEGSTLDRDEPVDMEHDVCVDNPIHFHKILEEGEMPLYSGCDQFTKFSATFKLYNLKAKYGWSDTSFTDLLVMIRKMLPEDNLLPSSCICVYIWHLYKDCESTNLLDKFRFVNPYKVSHNSKVDLSERATIVGKRLIGTSIDQLVLLPCNVGWHWILLVVDPNKEIVYVLDPLSHEAHVEDWKKIMETAMKMFNMSIGKRGRQSVLWNMVKCQQQPDEKQCGFYVMRYMKDIIESSQPVSIPILFSEGFYLKSEIDEVRKGWAEFVDDFTN